MIRDRYNRIPHPALNTTRERDTYNQKGTKIKTAQVKSQGGSSFPTDGHKAILNKLNSKSKTNRTNKMACVPSEDSNQPGNQPSLIRVFAVRLKKPWVLSLKNVYKIRFRKDHFETCNIWAKRKGLSVVIKFLSPMGCLPLPRAIYMRKKSHIKTVKIPPPPPPHKQSC